MPRPLRLLTIGHSYAVGMNRRLAHEFSRQGGSRWDVTLVTPKTFVNANDGRPIECRVVPGEPCDIHAIETYWANRIHLFSYARRLSELIRDTSPDLVHAWEEPYVVAGWQIARATPKHVPFVFWTAQNLAKRYPPPFGFFERTSVACCSGWLACGESTVQTLIQRGGYAKRPHMIAPLGVDLERYAPDENARREMRNAVFGCGQEDAPIVGYLGRFVPEKGLDVLMNALDALPASTKWRAMFVGAGPMRAAIDAWAVRCGDRVRVCTNVSHEDVPRYLAAMDILAAPSLTTRRWREQFGRMLIEAMSCGVAVVGSDSGEIPHVLAGGEAGVVVSPENDVGKWTEALGALIENPSRRRAIADAGHARVQDRYSWATIGRQTLSFFERLLQGRPGR